MLLTKFTPYVYMMYSSSQRETLLCEVSTFAELPLSLIDELSTENADFGTLCQTNFITLSVSLVTDSNPITTTSVSVGFLQVHVNGALSIQASIVNSYFYHILILERLYTEISPERIALHDRV